MQDAEKRLTPEARDLLEIFSARMQQQMSDLGMELNQKIDTVRAELMRSSEAGEGRLAMQISEVKSEQREQRKMMEEQGKKIVEIETRLTEGDRKFDHIEQRLTKVEESEGRTGKGVAYLAGALGAGAAIGGSVSMAVSKLLH